MIVQCPYCATRYQLEEDRFTAPNPMLKCSRCRHVFPAPGAKKTTSSKAKKTPPPEDESLTLPFEKESWKDEDAAEVPSADHDEQEGFVLGDDGDDSVVIPEESDAAVEEPEAELAEELEIAPEAAELPEAEPDLSYDDDDEQVPIEAPRRQTSPDRVVVRAVLIFLVVVVAGYGMLTRALLASPALASRLLGPLPLIGTLASDRKLARDVALVGVQGGFQKIKDGSEVFVITGDVVSAAPVTLDSVEVRGRLFGQDGDVLREKSIYCGNAVSAKILRDLTTREVSVLQKIAPPKQFGIKPGDTAPFVIVFLDPPKQAAEFGAQVIAASDQL